MKFSLNPPSRRNLIGLFSAIAIIFQFTTVWQGYAKPMVVRIASIRGLPAWKRAAYFLQGEEFSEYMEFVRLETPPDARIILPPQIPITPYTQIPFIQYFLFPRDIHNCGVDEIEACVKRVQGMNTYILAVDQFPPHDLASQFKDYLPFSTDLGLFVPPSSKSPAEG